ncbi:hypothetical protein scyTo_0010625 [Scyliorhinus torazame]|uniref:PDZ domain-containing protein n=1 Tax=Scyliorhinus torazame TaxID=75743 RepID=A0A401P9L2_SCYTO|nr:hypothetical protein [Scyliorhinus torazame]
MGSLLAAWVKNVNNINVVKVGHKQVVSMIRQGGNNLLMKVVTVSRKPELEDGMRKKDESLTSTSTESLEGLINIFKDDDASEENGDKSDQEESATTPPDPESEHHTCDCAVDWQEDLAQDPTPVAGSSKGPLLDCAMQAGGSTMEDQGTQQPQLRDTVPETSPAHTQQMLEQTIHLLHEAVQNFHVTVQSGYTQMHSDMTRSHTIMQFGWAQFTEQVGCLVSLLKTLVRDHQASTPQLRDVAVQSSLKSPEGQSAGVVLPTASSPVADVLPNTQCNPVGDHLNDGSSQSSVTCPVNRTHVHSFNI